MKYIYLVLILFLAGCSIQERAAKKVSWTDRKSPITLVQWCSENVPVRADTQRIPGKTIFIPGVIKYVDCDSVTTDSTNADSGSLVGVPCPPSTHTVDTYRVVSVDSAALMTLRGRFDSMRYVVIVKDHEIARAKGSKKTMVWIAVIAGVIALVEAVLIGLLIRSKSPI